MGDYLLDGCDLKELFSIESTLISFSGDLKTHVPSQGSIIYTIWGKGDEFVYVGIAGIQPEPRKRQGLSRMKAHASGRRSGDQFCVYVQDFFVIPDLVKSGSYLPRRGLLDELTKDYIRTNLRFRVKAFTSGDSDRIVRSLEDKIKRGVFGISPPTLNGIST
jgi:hypothetical protein